MKQYCRYCNNCIYGDFIYCDANSKIISESKSKSANQCKNFVFNPIDIFNFEHEYKPRKQKKTNDLQGKLF